MFRTHTRDFTLFFSCDLREGTNREINAVGINARWAIILNSDSNSFAILRVCDCHGFAARKEGSRRSRKDLEVEIWFRECQSFRETACT